MYLASRLHPRGDKSDCLFLLVSVDQISFFYKTLCLSPDQKDKPLYSCGIIVSQPLSEVNARLRLTLFWYKPSSFSYENYTRKIPVNT